MSVEPFYLGENLDIVERELEGGIHVKEFSPSSLHAMLGRAGNCRPSFAISRWTRGCRSSPCWVRFGNRG